MLNSSITIGSPSSSISVRRTYEFVDKLTFTLRWSAKPFLQPPVDFVNLCEHNLGAVMTPFESKQIALRSIPELCFSFELDRAPTAGEWATFLEEVVWPNMTGRPNQTSI
jgi:hypothetical protein